MRKAILCSVVPALLVTAALSFSACDLVGDDPATMQLVPLEVGNRWSYSLSNRTGSRTDSFTMHIEKAFDVQIGGRRIKAFARATQPKNQEIRPGRTLLANESDGLHLLGGFVGSDTVLLNDLFRKYPADQGETWPAPRLGFLTSPEDHAFIRDTLEQKLIAVDEILETPAGTFECHVYRYSFQPAPDCACIWVVYDYYVPGIGRVAEIVTSEDPEREPLLIQRALLYEYSISK